jgi:hypothetical protein
MTTQHLCRSDVGGNYGLELLNTGIIPTVNRLSVQLSDLSEYRSINPTAPVIRDGYGHVYDTVALALNLEEVIEAVDDFVQRVRGGR